MRMKYFLVFIGLAVIFDSCDTRKIQDETLTFTSQFDSIYLVSYDSERGEFGGSAEVRIENNKIRIPGITIVDNLKLDSLHSHKIFDILLDKKTGTLADCYNPRHILTFYKNGKLIGFFEFCATCGGSQQSKNIVLPIFTREKGKRLIPIFKEMNLKRNGDVGF